MSGLTYTITGNDGLNHTLNANQSYTYTFLTYGQKNVQIQLVSPWSTETINKIIPLESSVTSSQRILTEDNLIIDTENYEYLDYEP